MSRETTWAFRDECGRKRKAKQFLLGRAASVDSHYRDQGTTRGLRQIADRVAMRTEPCFGASVVRGAADAGFGREACYPQRQGRTTGMGRARSGFSEIRRLFKT